MKDPKTIQMTRRLIVEAMLLGMALSKDGDAERVRKLKPDEFTSHANQLILQSILDQNRPRFSKLMNRRYSMQMDPADPCGSLMKHLKKVNAVDAALDMTEILLLEVEKRDELRDIEEKWSEALVILRRAIGEMETDE